MNENFFDIKLMAEAVELAEKHKAHLHEIPEVGMEEYKTTEYIKKVCSNYDLSYIDLGMDTGLVAYLDAGKSECVALRADIDALPTDNGPNHLCGHDAHTSTMLGALHYLCNARDSLKSNVLFIFQPSEEGTKGARNMIAAGLWDKIPAMPKWIFGIHNRPEVAVGDVVVHKGPLMSAKSEFYITLTGRSGHSSTPHVCIDPIVAAAHLITAIQSIKSKNISPAAHAICSINSIKAGEPSIPMPDEAHITGFFRSYDPEVHARMDERVRQIAKYTAEAYECKCDIEIVPAADAIINSDEMYEIGYKAAELAVGKEHVIDSEPCMASEDFSYFGEYVPSFFYWVGSGEPGVYNAPWHDANFRVADGYFEAAVPVLSAPALI